MEEIQVQFVAVRQARAIALADGRPERANNLALDLARALKSLDADERWRRVLLIDVMLSESAAGSLVRC